MNSAKQEPTSAGARFRVAVAEGRPLQVVGAITDGRQKAAVGTMQSHADLYQYLGHHEYEDGLDALFATKK